LKKVYLLLTIFVLFVTACSTTAKEEKQNDVVVYFAKGETWASTYTLIDAGETIFDSLYIQHIGDREQELGPIEYVLEGGGMKLASQYPLKLQSVRSLQVSSEFNKAFINIEASDNKEYKLVITQDGKTEELLLKLIEK
jgi:hypothetical protein